MEEELDKLQHKNEKTLKSMRERKLRELLYPGAEEVPAGTFADPASLFS